LILKKEHLAPALFALLAALLFGASAPLAKLLLGELSPLVLAGLLYLGSGFGVLLFKLLARSRSSSIKREAPLQRADMPWLAGATLAGGIAAPVILLFSLRSTPAATASLLLNFEGVATTLLAGLLFKEAVSKRAWLAIAIITMAGMLLSVNFAETWGVSAGALGILLACALWGLDNNLTRHISAKDPLTIVIVKGVCAGTVSLTLGLLTGGSVPAFPALAGALLLGFLSYGASIVLFIRAMRQLGAARTSALFTTAPLAGVGLSFLLFTGLPGTLFWIALPLMIFGASFLINEDHGHWHAHQPATHDHAHSHTDRHHEHSHPTGMVVSTSHSHMHEHTEQEHEHPHLPDTHHRHSHSGQEII
jgi:drug/metabolite transporter (DMT)-like permease